MFNKEVVDDRFPVFWGKLERRVYALLVAVAEEERLSWVQNDVRNLVRTVANSKRQQNAEHFLGVPLPGKTLLFLRLKKKRKKTRKRDDGENF